MSIHQFLLALRARAGVFGLLLAATVAIVTVASVLLPKTYVATVSLLVDRRDEQSLSVSPSNARQQVGYLQTQVDILTSRRVANEVVRKMKLEQNPALREAFEKDTDGTGSMEAWLTEQLLKKLKVDTSQSSVVQLMYSANDPQLATDIANAFAAAYTDVTLQLRVEPTREAAVWFDDQLKELRNTIEQRQAKLTAYYQKTGLVPTDERLDIESARLAELSTQLLQAQNASFDSSTRRRQATDSLSKGSAIEMLPEILAQPFIQAMKTELVKNEMKLTELAGNLGPNHPQYQRAKNEHAALRAKLDTEMNKVVGGLDNSARQTRAREEELQKALQAQRAQVLRLKEARNEVAVLAREVDSAQKAYDIALQRAVVNKVDSRARQTNVSVLTAATPPLEAARPKLGLNVGLSLIVGLLLGLTAVYLLESIDRRVRSRGDLEGELNAPLLVVLDDIRSKAPPRLLGPGIRATPALLPRLE